MVVESPQDVLPFPTLDVAPVRGARWVLQWAAALAVLSYAAAILSAFAFQLAAEKSLFRAAAAGLREATCERATDRTVAQSIRRRLVESGIWGPHVTIALRQNGVPVSGVIRAADGDRLSVTLSVPTIAVLPGWLSAVVWLPPDRAIRIWADRQSIDS
jgi:hypothetical protein